jgi:hypothetical protein
MAWEEYSRSKWETIANNMPKYGCPEKWPKELVQRKWQEMHPSENAPTVSDYESKWGGEQRAWSDGGASRTHSLHEGDGGVHLPTTTTATIEGTRSRAGSGAASPLHFPQPQHILYDNQQQHGVWGAGH